MHTTSSPNGINLHTHLQIAKALLLFFNLCTITVYGFLLIMFSDFPINLPEEAAFALTLLGIASGIAITLCLANLMADSIYRYIRQNKPAQLSTLSFRLEQGNLATDS